MTMDIQTPKGQATLQKERKVIAAFHKLFPKFQYIETDKDRDAVNDGVIWNREKNCLVAVCETKCREASLDQLIHSWGWEWLVTHKKIKRCAFIAREMRVLFTGILYLADDKLILMNQLYDGNADKWLVKMRTEDTETQRNVNGGRVIRENAFIDMSGAKRFPLRG